MWFEDGGTGGGEEAWGWGVGGESGKGKGGEGEGKGKGRVGVRMVEWKRGSDYLILYLQLREARQDYAQVGRGRGSWTGS